MNNVIQNIRTEDIVPNNYHKEYDKKEIENLASSIKKYGLLEPITVREKNQKYELILGNKRYKACLIAGIKTIPAIIKQLTDDKVQEYLQINNNSINNISNSIKNNLNLDVINLSKLNDEYERDELKMNNNQYNNNIQQPINNAQNEPTFGGRFFPSLEDEPTNMNFGTMPNMNQMAGNQQPTQPINNNFIDLTDLNINSTLNQSQPSNMIEQNEVNNLQPQPNLDTFSAPNIPNLNNQPNINENSNIINLESLKQNQEMGTQPINQEMNVDNNFQEVITDFNPYNNMIQPQPINSNENQMVVNQELTTQPNLETVMPNSNMEMNLPQQNIEPIMPEVKIEEPVKPIQEKNILPVINSLKGLAVNLEAFGYTIRITDEDLSSSYKITIEVDK